ncbi:phage antirepressor KilAC domain-containing protein [Sutcliffiella cohnii]
MSKGTVTITQIAKDYGMSEQWLNRILNQGKVKRVKFDEEEDF